MLGIPGHDMKQKDATSTPMGTLTTEATVRVLGSAVEEEAGKPETPGPGGSGA